jgi:hypothetical protein
VFGLSASKATAQPKLLPKQPDYHCINDVLNQLQMEILGRAGWNQIFNEKNFTSQQRRHFVTEQKATILKRYLVDIVGPRYDSYVVGLESARRGV